MREIKYQAYDTLEKRMIEWNELLDFGSGLAEYFKNPRELKFREYTGLKDKNGKEIYEGDIIKHNSIVQKIVWEDAQFVLKWGDNFPSHRFAKVYANIYKVIGNVYENPELLEKSND